MDRDTGHPHHRKEGHVIAEQPIQTLEHSSTHNDQGERREAAATDVRFVCERDGCLPFARPCGLAGPCAWERLSVTTIGKVFGAWPAANSFRRTRGNSASKCSRAATEYLDGTA